MIYPDFPKSGDLIGICAPSAGVGHKIESFDMSLDILRDNGFSIIETPAVRVDSIRPAAADVRAEEFHSLISNPQVKSVIAASGGEYNYELLPYLNDELIKKNPKWFCGYSDPTNILYYMTTKLDIATIYGFNAGAFDWRPLHDFQRNALKILSGDLITQHSYEFWDSERDWENINLNTPIKWDLYMPGVSAPNSEPLNISGRLIGGCTDIIAKLIGTPYDATAEFISRYSEDGFIWYFDTFDMNAASLYLTMLQFKYAGFFHKTRAVLFGRVMYPGDSTDADYIENLKMVFDDINVPFVWGADIGHTKPAMTLINGSIAELSLSNSKASLCTKLF